MALLVDMEGTSSSGEVHEMDRLLIANGVSTKTVQKLIDNSFQTIAVLRELKIDELDEICKEFGILLSERVKLRAVVRSIKAKAPQSNLPSAIIDREERYALTAMGQKIKAVEESISLIGETTKNISDDANQHRINIRSAFKALHQSLDEREAVLLSKVDDIESSKNGNLKKMANDLSAKKAECQRKLNECELKVAEPTELDALDARIETIAAMAREVQSVEVVTTEHDAIQNTKIDVLLINEPVIAAVSQFGSVSSASGRVPVLMSLRDKGDGSVSIDWKVTGLESRNVDGERSKLKVEWNETKSDDLAQFKETWDQETSFNIGHRTQNTLTVRVQNAGTFHVFRALHFDGRIWSSPSPMKVIFVDNRDEDVVPEMDDEDAKEEVVQHPQSVKSPNTQPVDPWNTVSKKRRNRRRKRQY
jgi:hypothetical protein